LVKGRLKSRKERLNGGKKRGRAQVDVVLMIINVRPGKDDGAYRENHREERAIHLRLLASSLRGIHHLIRETSSIPSDLYIPGRSADIGYGWPDGHRTYHILARLVL